MVPIVKTTLSFGIVRQKDHPPWEGRPVGSRSVWSPATKHSNATTHTKYIFIVQRVGGFLWYGTSSANGVEVAVSCRFHHVIVPIGCSRSRADAATTVLDRHNVDSYPDSTKGLWAIVTEFYS